MTTPSFGTPWCKRCGSAGGGGGRAVVARRTSVPPAQVGGNQWIRRDLDQVVPSDGMDETAIDPQRYPGSRGVRAERELVAEKDDDPTAGGDAIDLHRDTIDRGRNGIVCG